MTRFSVAGCLFLLLASPALADPLVLFTDVVSGPNSGGEDGYGTYLSIYDRHGISLGQKSGADIQIYNNIIYRTGLATGGAGGIRPNSVFGVLIPQD